MKNNVLAQLSSVQGAVTSMVSVCLASKKVSQLNTALGEAKAKTAVALSSVAEHPHRRALSQTKKSLTAIDNLLAGLMHGLETRELRVSEFRTVCSNLQSNFVQKFGESLSNEIDKFKSEAGIDDDDVPESDEALTENQEQIRQAILSATAEVSEDEEESEYDVSTREKDRVEKERQNNLANTGADVERRLARLRQMRSLLPERMTAPYSMLRLPVVPNFETEAAKNPVLLDKLAIPFTEIPLYGAAGSGVPIGLTKVKMERYVIFEQQMILLISKDYVNSLLEHKAGKIDEENKEDFGEHRKTRKELSYRLDVAKKAVDKAVLEFQQTPSQKEEIGRLTEKLKRLTDEVDAAIRSQYSDAEKEVFSQSRRLRGKISIEESRIDKLQEDYRNKVDERNVQKHNDAVETIFKNIGELEKQRAPFAKKISVINKKYSKTLELKKKVEQIEIVERKLDKAKAEETARNRLIPDAEAEVKRLTRDDERNEETLKNKRKTIRRAGDPITPEDYARSVLSVINERSGSKYALVTPVAAPNPRNSRDILCFWLMPTSKLTQLMKATSGKAKVMQWDFPFESERHVHVNERRTGWQHPSDDDTHAEFLEYEKNKHHRPEGWKSRYGKPAKRPE